MPEKRTQTLLNLSLRAYVSSIKKNSPAEDLFAQHLYAKQVIKNLRSRKGILCTSHLLDSRRRSMTHCVKPLKRTPMQPPRCGYRGRYQNQSFSTALILRSISDLSIPPHPPTTLADWANRTDPRNGIHMDRRHRRHIDIEPVTGRSW